MCSEGREWWGGGKMMAGEGKRNGLAWKLNVHNVFIYIFGFSCRGCLHVYPFDMYVCVYVYSNVFLYVFMRVCLYVYIRM